MSIEKIAGNLGITDGYFMTSKIFNQLGKTPLVEVIFELRFEAAAPAAGDLLPGLLYSALRSQYPNVVPLPLSSVPREIRDQNADLKYQASHRLAGGSNLVQVGDRVLMVTALEYPGWAGFKEKVELVLQATKKTDLIKRVERFSFKYVNLMEAEPDEAQLQFLNLRVDVMGKPPTEAGFRLRLEQHDSNFVTIIEIIPNTTAKHTKAGKHVFGLLVTVDTIRSDIGEAFFANTSTLLEEGHSCVKEVFYSLLSEDGLKRLEPIE